MSLLGLKGRSYSEPHTHRGVISCEKYLCQDKAGTQELSSLQSANINTHVLLEHIVNSHCCIVGCR